MAQRLAGGLNWLATRMRADIAYAVSRIASKATRRPIEAITLGKRCLRYLAGTAAHGLSMVPNGAGLEGYGDAAFDPCFGQSGVIVRFGAMPIAWKSAKQPQTPRNTAEAECVAMAFAAQHVEGVADLLYSIGPRTRSPSSGATIRPASSLPPRGATGGRRASSTR